MDVSIANFFVPMVEYFKWHKGASEEIEVWACGYAYNGCDFYSGDALAQMITESVLDELDTGLNDFLRRLNGNWALVILTEGFLYAVSDRTRSFPLLYSELNGALCISDYITKVCSDKIIWRSEAVEDFLWAGYPTGTTTLVDGVNQIPAGMYLQYNINTKEKSLVEYFRFLPTNSDSDTENQLSERLSELLYESIMRIVKVARGKIIVPLSGGIDSRVIAALLRKIGFDNVLCFSYGRKGNPESESSKKVAEVLGYEWHFIEYSPDTWATCMFSQEMKDYVVYSCNGCSMPICSNWYAVKALCESGKVCAGDTFIPGHAGDFLAGSHIPREYSTNHRIIDQENIAEHIVKKHFSLWPGPPPETILLRLLDDFPSIGNDTTLNNIEAASLYEMWDWRERQAKFIINSNRIYEFFRCNWLTPLWDSQLTDFYLTVPFRLRYKRTLFFHSSVEHVFSDKLSALSDIPLATRCGFSPRQTLGLTQKELFWRLIRRMSQKMRRLLPIRHTLKMQNHALFWSHSFSNGKDPRQQTVRQVFENNGLGDVLNCSECDSIFKFLDMPVGYIHAFGLITLFALANMQDTLKRTKQ